MKKHKWPIIAMILALAIPLAFWWGVRQGSSDDNRFTLHGEELIRLQKDIQGLQVHVAELIVENDRLRSQIHKIKIIQNTIKIHIPKPIKQRRKNYD